MAASQTDKFKKAGLATVTTLAAPGKALAATSITVGSTTNFPTGTGLIVAIRQVNTAGTLVAGTYTEWRATVTSGTSLAIEATPVAGSDQVYAAGSTTQVFVPLSSYGYNEHIDGLLVSLDQDGTLKAGAVDNAAVLADNVVTTAKIADSAVTTAKIADNNVTAAKIATSAITLGYAQITSPFSGTSTSVADVTSLSVAVTIPAGGRRIKVTFNAPFVISSSVSGNGVNTYVTDVTAAAIIGQQAYTNATNIAMNGNFCATHVPAAGARTYKIQYKQDAAGTYQVNASATSPAFILVEAI